MNRKENCLSIVILVTAMLTIHVEMAIGNVAEPAADTTFDLQNSSAIKNTAWSYSGFLDVCGKYRNGARDHSEVSLLEAEFDLAVNPADKVNLSAAVTLEPSSHAMELTSAFATFDIGLRRNNHKIESWLTVGLFNPAFGIDCYNNNASCRKLSSAPLAVALTHQNWADMGVQFQAKADKFNGAVFAVNGFEPAEEVMSEVQSLVASLGDTVAHPPASAFGGRLGMAPIKNVEIGGSVAAGYNDAGDNDMQMWGANVTAQLSVLEIKAEYIAHSINRTIARSDNSGLYVQPTVSIKRMYATYRYDVFKADLYDRVTYHTFGVGYKVADPVEIRIETTLDTKGTAAESTAQLFVGF